ncbi:Conserved hypothetical protein [Clostridioides difficile T11]|nr:Conserved hypothetical protein [Clostridioides difficile T11]CCL29757.1 Conserved hypothetical protein [Clostridioides difficile E15]
MNLNTLKQIYKKYSISVMRKKCLKMNFSVYEALFLCEIKFILIISTMKNIFISILRQTVLYFFIFS